MKYHARGNKSFFVGNENKVVETLEINRTAIKPQWTALGPQTHVMKRCKNQVYYTSLPRRFAMIEILIMKDDMILA